MAEPEQKYRIIEKIDAGGMAEIYRGEAQFQQGFKKQVAIKRILPQLTKNKRFVSMFLDEARVSLYLDHANIVHVFEIGQSGGTFFIVMEFVDGLNLRTLSESLKRMGRRLEVQHALFIMMEVAKGLAYAHEKADPDTGKPLGIVHRDISPPNILLSKTGEVKLVDFGLAKAANQVEHTEPGVVKGKFSYLSPEAALGLDVDERADIFAAGIILFEMLTGRRLFYGETDYQTVELVRQAHVPPMVALNPTITPELEKLVLCCLARDPDDRYSHAYAMHDALGQYLFNHKLRVTNRDIAQLVRDCVAERQHALLPGVQPQNHMLDALIQEEVVKLTSLDTINAGAPIGAQPITPEELKAPGGTMDPRDYIDTRGWTSELEETENGEARMTFPALKVAPEEQAGFAPLEELLEAQPEEIPSSSSRGERGRRSKGSTRLLMGVLIALIVLSVLGTVTIVVLYSLGAVKLGAKKAIPEAVQPE